MRNYGATVGLRRFGTEGHKALVVLEVGRVALSGPSSELQEHESVRRSYLGY